MILEINFQRGWSFVKFDGKEINIKTAFLKKMYVGDLIEYIKMKDENTPKRK